MQVVEIEKRTWLCHRMHMLCAKYALCPKEQMIIPRRAVAAIHADVK